MVRPRKAIRGIEINVLIPQDLSAAIDILLWDPVLNKPKYGARSALITELLTEWVARQRPEFAPQSEVPLSEGEI